MGPSQFWKDLVLLLTRSMSHPVFHISNLKPFQGGDCSTALPLPSETVQNKPVSLLVVVCATRTILRHHKPEHQILVQWSNAPPENATWEPFQEFCKTYPNYHLEDKVVFQEQENDTPLPIVLTQPYQELGPEMQEDPDQLLDDNLRRSTQVTKPPVWMEDYTN